MTSTTTVRIPTDAVASIRADLECASLVIQGRVALGQPLHCISERLLIDLALCVTDGCYGIQWGRAPKIIREQVGRSFRLAYVVCATEQGARCLAATLRRRGFAVLQRRVRPYAVEVSGRVVSGYCVVALLSPNPDKPAQGWWQAPELAVQLGWQRACDAHYGALEAEDRADDEEWGRVVRSRGDVETWEEEDGREVDFLFVKPNRDGEYGVGYEVDRPLERELWALEQEVNVFWANDPHRQRAAQRARALNEKPLLTVADTDAYVNRKQEERAERFRAKARAERAPSADEQLCAEGQRAWVENAARAVGDLAAEQSEDAAWLLADDVLGD
jgi:hypothetical protein